MPKIARSARGEIVDFDLISIANQLASAPPPVTVGDRRLFINEKDGVKPKKNLTESVPSAAVHEALRVGQEALAQQKRSAKVKTADAKTEQTIIQDPSLQRPSYDQDADPS